MLAYVYLKMTLSLSEFELLYSFGKTLVIIYDSDTIKRN